MLAEEPAHGYELIRKLRVRQLAEVDAGGLYRTLQAMAKDGLVASHWQYGDAGPARRVYSITEQGRQWLPHGAEAARLMKLASRPPADALPSNRRRTRRADVVTV